MATSRLMLVPEPIQLTERFEVLAEWSRAGHRHVLRALDREGHGEVVLIVLPPPSANETGGGAHQVVLRSLMQRAAATRGPGLMAALEVAELNLEGRTWTAMVYADTDCLPLSDWLAERDALSLPQALRLVRGVCTALQGLHAQGLVHGCLDLHTVLMPQEGAPLLAGFGFIDPVLTDLRRAGQVGEAGSSFLAPEQLRYGRSDVQADIYALGRLLAALIGDWTTPPSHLRQVIAMCTAARPQDRFESVAQVIEALGPNPGSMAMADTSEALRSTPPVAPRPAEEPSVVRAAPLPAGPVTRIQLGTPPPTEPRPEAPQARKGPPIALWGALGLFGLGFLVAGAFALGRLGGREGGLATVGGGEPSGSAPVVVLAAPAAPQAPAMAPVAPPLAATEAGAAGSAGGGAAAEEVPDARVATAASAVEGPAGSGAEQPPEPPPEPPPTMPAAKPAAKAAPKPAASRPPSAPKGSGAAGKDLLLSR